MNNETNQNSSGWYAPMAPAPAPAPREMQEPPRRRGMPVFWQILLGTLLALGLIVVGMLIPAAAAWHTTDKYLRMSVDDLYLI